MKKIRLGKTEMMVSRLGLGALPLPRLTEEKAISVVKRALELGITFIDTAVVYTTSEERIGKAISGRRKNIILATKSIALTRKDMEDHIQLSMKRLGVDYIDLYQLHDVSDFQRMETLLAPDGALAGLEEAKKVGIIKHIGVSSHRMDVAKALVKSDRFETIMFPFNFITSEPAIELLPLAREHDVGFIAMKPLNGGLLGNIGISFKYLFQFPDVLPIPGIENESEIEEIVQFWEKPHKMTAADQKEMKRLKKELGDRFCRRCDYCQPCVQGIPISWVMSWPVFIKTHTEGRALPGFIVNAMEKAADCIEDGDCETRCPYHLPIREMIKKHYKSYKDYQSKLKK